MVIVDAVIRRRITVCSEATATLGRIRYNDTLSTVPSTARTRLLEIDSPSQCRLGIDPVEKRIFQTATWPNVTFAQRYPRPSNTILLYSFTLPPPHSPNADRLVSVTRVLDLYTRHNFPPPHTHTHTSTSRIQHVFRMYRLTKWFSTCREGILDSSHNNYRFFVSGVGFFYGSRSIGRGGRGGGGRINTPQSRTVIIP